MKCIQVFAALFIFQGCFLFLGLQAAAPEVFSRKQVESHILRFEFEQAVRLLSTCEDPYAKAFYLNHIHFFRFFATDDAQYRKSFLLSCDQSLSVFDKMPKSSPYKKYYQAEVYFLRGIVHFLSKKYVPAGLDLNTSYGRVKSNMAEFPTFRSHYKLMGLYEAGLSAVPEKYQYITNLLGFKGDLQRGMEKMKIAAKMAEVFPEEAELLSCYAERKLMDDTDRSLSCMRKLHAEDPDNILYTFMLANIAVNNRRSGEALKYLASMESWRSNKQIFYIQFLDYLRGKAHFYQLNYVEAQKDFNRFITRYKGSNFLGDALFKRALIYELNGDHETASGYFQEIAGMSKNDFDLDNYAIRYAPIYAARPFTKEELALQKARNLFDGGFFESAGEVLQPMLRQSSTLPDESQLELHYRLGRIHQEQKRIQQAKDFYRIAMGSTAAGDSPGFWMKVYSVYYLGGMHEREGNQEEAKRLYKLALSYKDYQHQNDLQQMAKSGLARLK
jgi:tetratricopeptide (TPR) repeat protein